MREMTAEQIQDFLWYGTRTLKVATIQANGSPHVVPVWFVLDGDDVVFSASSSSLKIHNLRRRPEAAVCVDDERPPFGFVSARGVARLEQRPPDLVEWTTRIARRYVGDAGAEEAGRRYASIDDTLVRIRLTSIVARAEVLD
jgi:PPOX class probable F420-dependent enzyme